MEIKSPKRRGRPPGSRNKPGHMAGRPSNGRQHGAVMSRQTGPPPTGEDPGRSNTSNKVPYRVANSKSPKVPYATPMPCIDGHNCPGNGNGGKPKVNGNPLPTPPAKTVFPSTGPPDSNALRAICQSGLNPKLITAEQVLGEIQTLAVSDIRLIPGCPDGIPDEIARAISSFTIIKTTHRNKDGSEVESEQVKYTLWNKNVAQDQLARYHGLYARDREQGRPNLNLQQNIQVNRVDLSDMSVEELRVALKIGLRIAEVNGSPVLDLSPELFGEGSSGVPG